MAKMSSFAVLLGKLVVSGDLEIIRIGKVDVVVALSLKIQERSAERLGANIFACFSLFASLH